MTGLRVIDLTRVLGGPYCTQILADHGANVIKVEPPAGDEVRDWGPPFHGEDAAYYVGINRNKRSIGLDLASVATEHAKAPRDVIASVEEHRAARASRDYQRADGLRGTFAGYRVDDQAADRAVVSRGDRRILARERRTISSAKELPDRRTEPSSRSWTVGIVTREYPDDLARCLAGALAYLPSDGEVVVLDSGSSDDAQHGIAEIAARDGRVETYFADRDLGEGAARNALTRVARGRMLLMLDCSVEITGDLFGPLAHALADPTIGLAGPWGLRTTDLKHFDEVTSGEAEAVQGYCAAARREVLMEIGGFDERYRFYRNLDIAVSLAARERGYVQWWCHDPSIGSALEGCQAHSLT